MYVIFSDLQLVLESGQLTDLGVLVGVMGFRGVGWSAGGGGGGVAGRDPKSNINRFQISRGWHLCNISGVSFENLSFQDNHIFLLGFFTGH